MIISTKHKKKAQLSLGDNGDLLLCFADRLNVDIMKGHEDALKELLNEHVGKEVPFSLKEYDPGQEFDTQFADLKEILNIQYEVEE